MVRAKHRWLGPFHLFFRSSWQGKPPVQPGKSVCGGGGGELVRKHLLEEGRHYLRKDDGTETCILGEGSLRETNVKREQAGPSILWKAGGDTLFSWSRSPALLWPWTMRSCLVCAWRGQASRDPLPLTQHGPDRARHQTAMLIT